MNLRDLLTELDAAGVNVSRKGDNLRVRGKSGVRLAPYTERICRAKPELLAVLSETHLKPIALVCMNVSRDEVDASRPPAGWDGTLPDTCAWPLICHPLGPYHRSRTGGPCRIDGGIR